MEESSRNWVWFLVAGIVYIIFGIFAFSWPISSTFGLTYALGVLFIVSGLMQLLHVNQLRKASGSGWRIFQAIIGLAAGVLMLRYPGAGTMGIGIAMAFYFFVSAAARGASAFEMRPHPGWAWSLASATASFLLGLFILATFPFSALWIPGFILGIDFVVYGGSLIGFSFDIRYVRGRVSEITEKPGGGAKAA